MKTVFVPTAKELMDIAMRKAKKKSIGKGKFRDKTRKKKVLESSKIKFFAEELSDRIKQIVQGFPSIENLSEFKKENLQLAVDVDKLKKALAHLNASSKVIQQIRSQCIKKIYSSKEIPYIIKARKQFTARADTVIKKCSKSLELLKEASKKLSKLPEIKEGMPTIIIAGFPNTGKTTLLQRLSGSKPKIAAYPFTTVSIQIGFFEERYLKYQVIDTPGLLDREESKRNIAEKKAIAALKHLGDMIVFVVDPTQSSGYELKEQKKLLEEIKTRFEKVPVLVVINKADIAAEKEIQNAKKLFENAVIEGEGIKSSLKEQIISEVKT